MAFDRLTGLTHRRGWADAGRTRLSVGPAVHSVSDPLAAATRQSGIPCAAATHAMHVTTRSATIPPSRVKSMPRNRPFPDRASAETFLRAGMDLDPTHAPEEPRTRGRRSAFAQTATVVGSRAAGAGPPGAVVGGTTRACDPGASQASAQGAARVRAGRTGPSWVAASQTRSCRDGFGRRKKRPRAHSVDAEEGESAGQRPSPWAARRLIHLPMAPCQRKMRPGLRKTDSRGARSAVQLF